MSRNNTPLQPEDYVEPRCLLCEEPYGAAPAIKPVPQQRIIEKMNEYMSRRDYTGAERHLLYWLEEARLGGDKRGELTLRNELVGHYRKVGDRDRALQNGEEALRLVEDLDFDGTISSGTTYVNVATACEAFGEYDRAAALFDKARGVYESNSGTDPGLLGGLYNNMALCKTAQRQFDEALALYERALKLMGTLPGGGLEQAITYLNMANAVEEQWGAEAAESRINDLVDRAWDLLDKPQAPQDGYYAFVCEKCAPTFSYYGYFAAAAELQKRAEAIYERA